MAAKRKGLGNDPTKISFPGTPQARDRSPGAQARYKKYKAAQAKKAGARKGRGNVRSKIGNKAKRGARGMARGAKSSF